MSTKAVVGNSMVRIRRVLSGVVLAVALGWASVPVAGPAEDLFAAATRGDASAVQALLAKGADVNAKDSIGATVLMLASFHGHFDVVQVLLAKGAEVNAKMSNGVTALGDASFNGHYEVVQALLDKGTEVNAKTSNGGTALMSA